MPIEKRRHRKSYEEPGHAHELTFSCYGGHPFLSRERTCLWLAESIAAARTELDFSLWAYVFMPNHVHLIVRPNSPEYSMPRILNRIKQPVSRKALAYLRKEAPAWLERIKAVRGGRTEYHFWQRGGGFDRNIIEPRTLARMIEYLHLNPVRKGLVERAADWRWSSAGYFEALFEFDNGLVPDPIPYEWTIGM